MTKVNLNNGIETKSDIFQWDIFKSDSTLFLYQNILKYFNVFQNRNFSILWLKWTQKMKMKQNQTFFHGTFSNLTPFYIKTYKSISITSKIEISQFCDFLWLKWTQTMEMKQNQTFFYGTYSNLSPYLFLSKYIEVFQWLSKSKFLNFMPKVNPKMKMKQNQTFFLGTYSNLTLFFIVCKILNYFNHFYYWYFSISLQNWAQSRKWNKTTHDMCKCDSIFLFTK